MAASNNPSKFTLPSKKKTPVLSFTGEDFNRLATSTNVLNQIGASVFASRLDLNEAAKILGTDDDFTRLIDEMNRIGADTSKTGTGVKTATRLANRDAALTARRQQREGLGASAQPNAVRRALAMAKGRQGTILGNSEDPGRKTVLGGGI